MISCKFIVFPLLAASALAQPLPKFAVATIKPAAPDALRNRVMPAARPTFAPPSLFAAVREQWGLKLEKAKGPLNVIVVESAQPPTEN